MRPPCAATASSGTIRTVDDDEATTLMLQALFGIKAAVYEIHDVASRRVLGEDSPVADGELAYLT